MTKEEFLLGLQDAIKEYPSEETQKSMEYYSEMIDDRVEDGMTEAEAIASLGSIQDIADQIKCELPLTTLVKYEAKKRKEGKKLPVWAIILLVISAPLWVSVLLCILMVLLSVYFTIWCVDFALWCMDLALAMGGIGGLLGMMVMFIQGSPSSAVCYLGFALMSAGLAVFLFLGCLYTTKGIIKGTKALIRSIKRGIVNKEA